MIEQEATIIALALDLVSLWENPKIKALARSDRNAAIEETRERLIEAVTNYESRSSSEAEHLFCKQAVSGSNPLFGTIRATIAHWANTGHIQPPVGDFWASDIDKMAQEIITALSAGQRGES